MASTFNVLSAVLSRVLPSRRMGKAKRFFLSRRGLIPRICRELERESRPIYWFHASSLGEYQIARPLMRSLRSEGDKAIVLTFFSPTGVEALAGKTSDQTCADYIFPLPLDSRSNARDFVSAVNPRIAVFMVAELWHNHLNELRKKGIPTLLVSCLVRRGSRYFKWHGRFQRRMLGMFSGIVVHDRQSMANLYRLGLGEKTRLIGDPLYDNALSIRDSKYTDGIIASFCGTGKPVFIAGSIHYDEDLELTAGMIRRHPEVKIIVVPHVISEDGLHRIKNIEPDSTVLYSEAANGIEAEKAHVLVIDFIGALSRIYRYGTAAYVGGGFTRLIHSVIEPLVYGIPVCFGPRIERKATPTQMIDNGTGTMVCNPDEINLWWEKTCTNRTILDEVRRTADEYSGQNKGGADGVVNIINTIAL